MTEKFQAPEGALRQVLRDALDKLRHAGGALATSAFNLKQHPGRALTANDCDVLDTYQRAWDAANTGLRAALAAQPQPSPAEGDEVRDAAQALIDHLWKTQLAGIPFHLVADLKQALDAQPQPKGMLPAAKEWTARQGEVWSDERMAGWDACVSAQAPAPEHAASLEQALASAMHALVLRGDNGTSPVYQHCAKVLEGYRSQAPAVGAELLDCEIAPRPLDHPLRDYHMAPGGGPLHAQWEDKPHRLIYDLIAAVRFYAGSQPPVQGSLP
ncbi:hypothetical protein [Pelomonas sp. Root1444]|uniref:hypothetical protein n=1 Tax=Pelomonas sp. Root1444 TaxID=1736464 RepID=UPI00070387AD|nr:hypothetical protein [Pelomonas sp. Root1444]KQY83731.1 hypothetical protein ASD35_24225 [Pelomonas sp. Root1444]